MNHLPSIRVDRRQLVLGASAGALASLARPVRAWIPASGDEGAAGAGDTLLFLIQLSGGNDGLDTIVPVGDDAYHAARPKIGLGQAGCLPLDEYRAFHPALGVLRDQWNAGHLAIVEGVGYPEPSQSHFKSLDVWHTGSERGRAAGEGWLGRLAEALYGERPESDRLMHVGPHAPYSLYSPRHPTTCFSGPAGFRWEENGEAIAQCSQREERPAAGELERLRATAEAARASSASVAEALARHRPRAAYPAGALGDCVRSAAALVHGGLGARVVSVEHAGYDSHVDQRRMQDGLLAELAPCLAALLQDLTGTPAAENTVVMIFSEFGRRMHENASGGTDHGAAAPVFLLGSRVRGGLYGKHPSLSELDQGNLVHQVDFRSVYASLIRDWFRVEPSRVLGQDFSALPFLAPKAG